MNDLLITTECLEQTPTTAVSLILPVKSVGKAGASRRSRPFWVAGEFAHAMLSLMHEQKEITTAKG
jgi:hypothetical protein